MLKPLSCVALVFFCLTPTDAYAAPQDKAQSFQLKCEILMKTDRALVARLVVVTPATPAAEMTKLEFRWRDKTSHSVALGIVGRGQERDRQAELLIVAQVTEEKEEHPAMLVFSTQQKSRGGSTALTSEAHPLNEFKTAGEVLQIDIKDGDYPIDKPVSIGKLDGKAMLLSIEPFPRD